MPWNLEENHSLAQDNGSQPSGDDLTLFHFSGIAPDDPTVLAKHLRDLDLTAVPRIGTLVADYVDALNACERSYYEQLAYGFATLSDGTVILDSWREAIRMDHPALSDIANPYDVTRFPNLHRRYKAATPDALKSRHRYRGMTMRLQQAVRRMVTRRNCAA